MMWYHTDTVIIMHTHVKITGTRSDIVALKGLYVT